MTKIYRAWAFILFAVITLNTVAQAQSPTATTSGTANAHSGSNAKTTFPFTLFPRSKNRAAGTTADAATSVVVSNLPAVGNGTQGRLTKWMGFNTQAVLGDSTIYEDKFGKVGIGTDTPTSRLTVDGLIESISGGIKFPGGTIGERETERP